MSKSTKLLIKLKSKSKKFNKKRNFKNKMKLDW